MVLRANKKHSITVLIYKVQNFTEFLGTIQSSSTGRGMDVLRIAAAHMT